MKLGNGIVQCDHCGYIQKRRPSSKNPIRCNNCHTSKVHDPQARKELRADGKAKFLINTSKGYESLIEEADERVRRLESQEQSYEDEDKILQMKRELLVIKKLYEREKKRVEKFLEYEPEIRKLEEELAEVDPEDLKGDKKELYEKAKSKLEKIKKEILPRGGGGRG